jgi:RNA 2',3'-cyclic 3'-phosphodiesterase
VANSEQLRLFVAIDPPEAVCQALAALPRPLRGVSWTPPHQYHLTLRFIGEVEAARREAIEAALAPIRVESFILPVEGAGSFPPGRPPRVLWAGIGTGHPRLHQLRQKVDDALLAACGVDLDVRTFHAHFTLGRCGRDTPPAEAARFVREHAGFEGPSFRVDAFTLYRSELRPGGAVHTPLQRVELTP